MVFRLFFPVPATTLTPRQQLEQIEFPIEKLPEVFQPIIYSASNSTPVQSGIMDLLRQYIDLQIQLHHLQTSHHEADNTKKYVQLVERIHTIVRNANRHCSSGFGVLADVAKKYRNNAADTANNELNNQHAPASYQPN